MSRPKTFFPVKVLFKSSKLWRDNHFFLREFSHFRIIAFLALLFSVMAASFEGLSISLLLSFLQSLTNTSGAPVKSGINWIDIWILGIKMDAASRLYRISALVLVSSCMRSLFNYLSQIYTQFTEVHLADRLRKQIFELLQSVNLSYFSITKPGDLINTLTTEMERFRQSFTGLAFLFTRGLTLVTYLIVMFLISWQLSIISILVFGLMAVSFTSLNRRVREVSFEVSIANGNFTSVALEFINGIRTVQTFATQDFERRRYYKVSSDLVIAIKKIVSVWTLVKPLAEVLSTIVLIGMVLLASMGIMTNGSLEAASLLTFFFLLSRLVPILQDLNGGRASLNTLQGSAEAIKQLLRTDNKTFFQNGNIQFTGLKHSIDLLAVDFGYDPSHLVLSDIVLNVKKGQMVALVGASGAGKTTLVDLIPRFYDPTKGHVLIDGIDLREIEINSLRQKMAVVSQDTFIFNTSVRDNIAYGMERATDAEIEEAARLANAWEFIQEMPESFETKLGDRGVRLSGGQRQRIAIARALLRSPEILILDEATSALDSVSERLIQESLEKLANGRTVIAIAHRLSTIVKADKVVVLEAGQIVEQGTYQELLVQRGKLWKYHQLQNEQATHIS
jgi:ATP-binding cassette, subfamily B, bacterial MsbA